MSWERDVFALLDDLESEAAAAYDADRVVEIADRSRAAYREVTLGSRLMASRGGQVEVEVRGVGRLSGVLDRVSTEWIVLGGPTQDWVVRLAAVTAIGGASPRSVPEVAWSPVTRLGFGAALRRLSEGGVRCVVHREDGAPVEGVLGRIGADFVEVEVGSGREVTLLPFGAVTAVQSRP